METSGVSIIVCTNRPDYFNNILKNYEAQLYAKKELIIILNKDNMELGRFRNRARKIAGVSIYKVPEKVSLGQCLNCGIAKASFPLIAKFDDDDYYSPYYLKEQVREIRRTKSDIVGKHSCLVYLEATKNLIIRSPKERHKYTGFVQGGTLLFKRKVLKGVRFPDKSLGEDVAFLKKATQKGYKTYSTSPFNYVYIRRKNKQGHTWKASDQFYLRDCQPIAITDDYRIVANRSS